MGKLILLSGPSCVGKGPLCKALYRFYPKISQDWQHLVLYNSRAPRPGELDGVDYHFRSESDIEALQERDGFLVRRVRNDLQAVDAGAVCDKLATGDLFYEGNPFIAAELLALARKEGLERRSVFLAPLSAAEIGELREPGRHVDMPVFVARVMEKKLLRRARRQKGELSLHDLQDIQTRAASAWRELSFAPDFDIVLPNHDGEDSENWEQFYYPLGDARRTLEDFVQFLNGADPEAAEKWSRQMTG